MTTIPADDLVSIDFPLATERPAYLGVTIDGQLCWLEKSKLATWKTRRSVGSSAVFVSVTMSRTWALRNCLLPRELCN